MTKYIEEHAFSFDKVFGEDSTNEEIYMQTVRPMIQAVFQSNAKVTCFAYGQTGSGKTHTMMGPSTNNNGQIITPGLYLLSGFDIFNFQSMPEYSHLKIFISFYEIYCGKLHDLLNDRFVLTVREDGKGNICITNMVEKEVENVSDLMKKIEYGLKCRTVGVTGANNDSSRSHAIMQISIRACSNNIVNNKGINSFINKQKSNVESMYNIPHGKITFIDLAGSERAQDVTDTNKQTRFDGAEINKSLLALKECIRALDQNKSHTPFRGSKLTLVLRDSFIGGNCKTLMIANISPSLQCAENTLNTLRYAERVKDLKKTKNNTGKEDTKEDLARIMMMPRNHENTIRYKLDGNNKLPIKSNSNIVKNNNSNVNINDNVLKNKQNEKSNETQIFSNLLSLMNKSNTNNNNTSMVTMQVQGNITNKNLINNNVNINATFNEDREKGKNMNLESYNQSIHLQHNNVNFKKTNNVNVNVNVGLGNNSNSSNNLMKNNFEKQKSLSINNMNSNTNIVKSINSNDKNINQKPNSIQNQQKSYNNKQGNKLISNKENNMNFPNVEILCKPYQNQNNIMNMNKDNDNKKQNSLMINNQKSTSSLNTDTLAFIDSFNYYKDKKCNNNTTVNEISKEEKLQELVKEHDQLIQNIILEEDTVVSTHREYVDNKVLSVKNHMKLIEIVEHEGSDLNMYSEKLENQLKSEMRRINEFLSKISKLKDLLAKETKLNQEILVLSTETNVSINELEYSETFQKINSTSTPCRSNKRREISSIKQTNSNLYDDIMTSNKKQNFEKYSTINEEVNDEENDLINDFLLKKN